MQIASFILVSDRAIRILEDQLDTVMRKMPSQNAAFLNIVPAKLQELGNEHPISIPFSSLYPLDQAAERQHERILSAFEDPSHRSRLAQMAEAASVPLYYVSPGRVRDFVRELADLRLAKQIQPEDAESLLGRRISPDELPTVVQIIEQFRHDLYQVYRDAADDGKGVVVFVINQPDEMTSEEGFPRAA